MANILRRHFITGLAGAVLTYLFWMSRPDWVDEMRFWRAVGDSSLIFLYVSLALGPVSRLAPWFRRFLSYRREIGIWFGLFAIVHTILILDGWMRWDMSRLMGYELLPRADQTFQSIRLESGFGMANLIGLLAVLIALPLIATSADWAMRFFGTSWKFMHYWAYTIFYLVVLHTAYFMYIHFTMSFHRPPPPDPNWFQIPFAVLTALVIALQATAFFITVKRARERKRMTLVTE